MQAAPCQLLTHAIFSLCFCAKQHSFFLLMSYGYPLFIPPVLSLPFQLSIKEAQLKKCRFSSSASLPPFLSYHPRTQEPTIKTLLPVTHPAPPLSFVFLVPPPFTRLLLPSLLSQQPNSTFKTLISTSNHATSNDTTRTPPRDNSKLSSS